MYKRIISIFLALLFLSGCTVQNSKEQSRASKSDVSYVKAVWITYYEMSELISGKSLEEYETALDEAFSNLSDKGFNRIAIQVRPFADAFYISLYFPISSYCFGEQGSDAPFDPLAVICEIAQKHNLEVEAWVNPYRVSNSADFSKLAATNKALEWQDTENLIVTDKGIFFNPASDEVIELITNGVAEIAENYNVASICFDDYFYPSSDESIDKESYEKNGGKLSLDDWRRDNVNRLVKGVYEKIKSIDESISFGISPAANIENNYRNLYADVELWATDKGYVDYINPQVYFGFHNEKQPFMQTVKEWAKTAECDLYISLPLYKAGLEDEYAGKGGMNEFIDNNNIISRQVNYLSKLDEIDGFYIFSYSFLNDSEEAENLYSAMQ